MDAIADENNLGPRGELIDRLQAVHGHVAARCIEYHKRHARHVGLQLDDTDAIAALDQLDLQSFSCGNLNQGEGNAGVRFRVVGNDGAIRCHAIPPEGEFFLDAVVGMVLTSVGDFVGVEKEHVDDFRKASFA